MDDESPFRSPQVLDAEEPLDERSKRLLQCRKAHRRLEFGIPAFLLASLTLLGKFNEMVSFLQGDLSQWRAVLGSWIVPSLIMMGIVSFALLPLFAPREFVGPLILVWLPLVSIVGIIAAMKKVQACLRAEGLEFGWLGPSEKMLLEQLRHRDGSPVDPKTLGMKR